MGLDTSSDTGLFMAFVDSQKQFRISALFFKSVAYASILVKKKKKIKQSENVQFDSNLQDGV